MQNFLQSYPRFTSAPCVVRLSSLDCGGQPTLLPLYWWKDTTKKSMSLLSCDHSWQNILLAFFSTVYPDNKIFPKSWLRRPPDRSPVRQDLTNCMTHTYQPVRHGFYQTSIGRSEGRWTTPGVTTNTYRQFSASTLSFYALACTEAVWSNVHLKATIYKGLGFVKHYL